MASTHTRKKPNTQSQKITSFFPSSAPPAGAPPSSAPPSLRPPPPPAPIQSSLLNVGMRVRKSVPEGYKTKSPSSSQPAYSPPTQQRIPPPASAPPVLRSSGRERELLPFCGLHGTGGIAQQQEEVPGLTYSSAGETGREWRKRRMEEEDEEEYEAEMEREMDAVFGEENEGRKRGGKDWRTEGDFDDADVGFLVMDVDS